MRSILFSLIALSAVPGIVLEAQQQNSLVPQAPSVPSHSAYAAPAEINIG